MNNKKILVNQEINRLSSTSLNQRVARHFHSNPSGDKEIGAYSKTRSTLVHSTFHFPAL